MTNLELILLRAVPFFVGVGGSGRNMSPSRLNDCWLMQHTKTEVLSGGLLISRIQAFLRTWFQHPRRKPSQRVHYYIWHGATYTRVHADSRTSSNLGWIFSYMYHARSPPIAAGACVACSADAHQKPESPRVRFGRRVGCRTCPSAFCRGCRAQGWDQAADSEIWYTIGAERKSK